MDRNDSMSENVTIYDIAKACDVSIATVSRVLNKSPRVSQKTKEKILAAIKDLQYNPSPFARSMGLQSLRLIGIVCPTTALEPVGEGVAHITHFFQRHGYGTLLCIGTEEDIHQTLKNQHVDGIMSLYDALPPDIASGVPTIVIEGDHEDVYQIQSAIAPKIDEIIENLAKQGFTRPLCLWDDRLYLKRLKNALNRHDVKVISVPSEPDWTKLRHHDCVIASTAPLAVLAASYLRTENQSLPVVSLSESPLTEALGLTSLQTHFLRQCETGAHQLLTLMTQPETAVPIRTEFQAHWIYRSGFPVKP